VDIIPFIIIIIFIFFCLVVVWVYWPDVLESEPSSGRSVNERRPLLAATKLEKKMIKMIRHRVRRVASEGDETTFTTSSGGKVNYMVNTTIFGAKGAN